MDISCDTTITACYQVGEITSCHRVQITGNYFPFNKMSDCEIAKFPLICIGRKDTLLLFYLVFGNSFLI